jgi:hypothetical protein
MPKPKTKTEVATIKLTLQVRQAWEAAAAAERRSLANMFEVAILDYCEKHGVPVPPEASALAPAAKATATRKATRKSTV